MLTTPHTILGIYLVSTLPPGLALPAALVSHYLFDFFYPHWNPHLFTEMKEAGRLSSNTLLLIAIDVLTALSLVFYFALKAYPDFTHIIFLFLGALFAILPDLLEVPFYFFKTKNKFIRKLVTFEHLHQARANIVWGSLSQILVILVCLWNL